MCLNRDLLRRRYVEYATVQRAMRVEFQREVLGIDRRSTDLPCLISGHVWYVNERYGVGPSVRSLASSMNAPPETLRRYVREMAEIGALERRESGWILAPDLTDRAMSYIDRAAERMQRFPLGR